MSMTMPGYYVILVPINQLSQLNSLGTIPAAGPLQTQPATSTTGLNSTSFLPDTVTFAPNQEFNQTFAFAENSIAAWDSSQDGKLDFYEMTNMLGGNYQQASQLLNAVDDNADFQVDAVEVAADLLYADNASATLASTIEAYLPDMNSPQLQNLYQQIVSVLGTAFPFQLDGRITPQEENMAFASIRSPLTSFFAKQSIAGIINTAITDRNGVTATLRERYQTFQNNQTV